MSEGVMSEDVVRFGPDHTLVGILHSPPAETLPASLPGVVLLNAGILHRVGPNRLYVQIARRLASRGFHVLRFDLAGIGDSGNAMSGGAPRTHRDDVNDAMACLLERGRTDRFLFMGICMGARIALDVAAEDPRVDGAVLMEGIYIKSLRYHVSRVVRPEKWLRVLTGKSHNLKRVRAKVASALPGPPGERSVPTAGSPDPIGSGEAHQDAKAMLGRMLSRGTKVLLVFRDGNEIAHNYSLRRAGTDIDATGLPSGLEVSFIPFADHTFTPLVSQDLLIRRTITWIESSYLAAPAPVEAAR